MKIRAIDYKQFDCPANLSGDDCKQYSCGIGCTALTCPYRLAWLSIGFDTTQLQDLDTCLADVATTRLHLFKLNRGRLVR